MHNSAGPACDWQDEEMTAEWVPFGLDEGERDQYLVLVAGVPTWLREPLLEWAVPTLLDGNFTHTGRLLEAEMATRLPLGAQAGDRQYHAAIRSRLRAFSDEQLLRLVDYLIGGRSTPTGQPARQLAAIFQAGRSKWTVGDRLGRAGLVERVPAGVQTSVEGTIANSDSAGEVLARAWAHVHGLERNDSSAYADSVRAVEIAAIKVVQPNHSTATLGTVLGQMKADGDWRLPLREHTDAPGPELVLAMGRTLWHGHRDRHGSTNYSDVTHEEARAAVVLAASLVEWFTSGALARRT